jgi:hypothetical protein
MEGTFASGILRSVVLRREIILQRRKHLTFDQAMDFTASGRPFTVSGRVQWRGRQGLLEERVERSWLCGT